LGWARSRSYYDSLTVYVNCLNTLGTGDARQTAATYFEESLAIKREIGDRSFLS